MDIDVSSHDAVKLAYDVTAELTGEFEKSCLAGEFDESLLPVLSGCYSVINYFANIPAVNSEDDDEIVADQKHTIQDYKNAVTVMRRHIGLLCANIEDDCCPGQVDYKKVHALVGLQAVTRFILQAIGDDA